MGQEEFQQIYTEFQPRLARYLARLVGDDEADDLAQEVLLRASQAFAGFRGECALSTWLYRIATNAALDRLRSPSYRRRAGVASLDGDGEGSAQVADRNVWTGEPKPLVEQQVVRKEMNACLDGYIERLPASYRAVLVLRDLEGLSNRQVATILGISLGAVKIRLHRAREKLRQMLVAGCDPYWIERNEFVPDLNHLLK